MKELYNSPLAEFIEFDEADVIATSGCNKYSGSQEDRVHRITFDNCTDEGDGVCYMSH